MTARFKPIHCGFETLRLANEPMRSSQGHRHTGFAANEQMIARGTGAGNRTSRPIQIFADFREY